jgi:hypothetical protein
MLSDTCQRTLGQLDEQDGIHHQTFQSLERAANAKNPCYICDKLLRIHYRGCGLAEQECLWDTPDHAGVTRPFFTRYSLPLSFDRKITAGRLKFYLPRTTKSDSVFMKEVAFQLNEVVSGAEYCES